MPLPHFNERNSAERLWHACHCHTSMRQTVQSACDMHATATLQWDKQCRALVTCMPLPHFNERNSAKCLWHVCHCHTSLYLSNKKQCYKEANTWSAWMLVHQLNALLSGKSPSNRHQLQSHTLHNFNTYHDLRHQTLCTEIICSVRDAAATALTSLMV